MRNFTDVKRLVIKIGTNSITKTDGAINVSFLSNITRQILELRKKDKEIIIVSSGAIGCGLKALNLSQSRDIKIRQTAAAIGQTTLMNHWQKAFHKQKVAQLLLTYESFTNRKTYLNLTNTIEALVKFGIIPIVNENDPIAVDEIGSSFGDNDKMSALLASKVDASMLIILSNVDGLYNKNPNKNNDVRLLREVTNLDQNIKDMGHKASSGGKGGMITKLESAEICMNGGVYLVIANATTKHILTKITAGEEIGTLFIPKSKMTNKRRWIRFTEAKGLIHVDIGAARALRMGRNLLPVGVTSVGGHFNKGDVVELYSGKKGFAKAMVNYSSSELIKIKGKSGKGNVYSKGNVVLV